MGALPVPSLQPRGAAQPLGHSWDGAHGAWARTRRIQAGKEAAGRGRSRQGGSRAQVSGFLRLRPARSGPCRPKPRPQARPDRRAAGQTPGARGSSARSSPSPSALRPELHLPLQPRAGGGCGNRREWEWTGGRARGRVGGPRASVPRTPRTVCHGGTTECFRPPQIFPRPTLTAQARASDTAAAHQGRRCPGTHPSQGSRNSCEWGGLRPGARGNKAAGKRAPAWGASV